MKSLPGDAILPQLILCGLPTALQTLPQHGSISLCPSFRNALLQHRSPQAAAPPDPLHWLQPVQGLSMWDHTLTALCHLRQSCETWPPGLFLVYCDPSQSSLLSWKLKYLVICSFSSSIHFLVSPNTFCVGASDDSPNYWLKSAQRDRADENNRLSSQKYYFRTLRYD